MKKVSLFIDNKQIEADEGQSILNAALEAGIYIPHLCSHPDLTPAGECKLCIVEIEGTDGVVTSCTESVRDGIKVSTKSEKLRHYRNVAMEFMLAGHPHECTSCKAYLKCELQALIQYLGIVSGRFKTVIKKTTTINKINPLILRESERCILCGRCVRACRELRDVGIIDFRKLDAESYIGTENDLQLTDSGCRFCGACVEVCPTGALQDVEGVFNNDLPRDIRLVPCTAECPAHIDIPRYVRLVNEGKYSEAAGVIREKVPFPHALGYVCNRKCEEACRREKLNEAVSVRNLKRFAAENDRDKVWKNRLRFKDKTGKKIAVIGSGPAGLTAAYYLRKSGHEVTVYERLPVAGGMMTTCIPEYRCPGKDVQTEIDVIREAGVNIITGHNIDSAAKLKDSGFDAVLVATGAPQGKRLPVNGSDCDGVYTAVEVLRAVRLDNSVDIGETVTIIGGGSVAFDCARTVLRIGAEAVNVVCLEPEGAMLAEEEEILQAKEEGINIFPGKSCLSIEGSAGRVTGLKTVDVTKFYFENDGSLVCETAECSETVIQSENIIFAAGQKTDLNKDFGIELNKFGYPVMNKDSKKTGTDGIFAAGDVITGTKFVIEAIEAGREAASEIDLYLGGDGDISEELVPEEKIRQKIGKSDGFAFAKREECKLAAPAERIKGFSPVETCFSEEQAAAESARCLQCDLRVGISTVNLWTHYATKEKRQD